MENSWKTFPKNILFSLFLKGVPEPPSEVVQSCLVLRTPAAQESATAPAVVLPLEEGELDPTLLAAGAEGVRHPDRGRAA